MLFAINMQLSLFILQGKSSGLLGQDICIHVAFCYLFLGYQLGHKKNHFWLCRPLNHLCGCTGGHFMRKGPRWNLLG